MGVGDVGWLRERRDGDGSHRGDAEGAEDTTESLEDSWGGINHLVVNTTLWVS